MRNIKQRNKRINGLFLITALIGMLYIIASFAVKNAGALDVIGNRTAIFSAALNMPDVGLAMLKDRFQSSLYSNRIKEDTESSSPEEKNGYITEYAPESPQPHEESAVEEEIGVKPKPQPKIPAKYRAKIISENFAGRENGVLIPLASGFIKNTTKISNGDVEEILAEDFDLSLVNTTEPQVLIVHTHATESFERYDSDYYDTRNTWRSTDNNNNMVAVGNALGDVLEENGIGVIHDTTQHDYPSYNGSYERSAVTIKEYLDQYPSIKIVLDLHRDAMEREDSAIVKPVVEIDGKKAAQIMIISGCDDGTMNMPDWARNLRFASAFQTKMEQEYPDLTRPIFFCYRKYNMNLSDGSLLLEFGSNANTLDEAVYSAQLAGNSLAELIKENYTDD